MLMTKTVVDKPVKQSKDRMVLRPIIRVALSWTFHALLVTCIWLEIHCMLMLWMVLYGLSETVTGYLIAYLDFFLWSLVLLVLLQIIATVIFWRLGSLIRHHNRNPRLHVKLPPYAAMLQTI